MFLFVIKKTFFDMWDNLLRIFLINIGFILILGLSFYSIYLVRDLKFFVVIISGIALIIINIFIGAATFFVMGINDYKKPGFFDFYDGLKKSLLPGLLFSVIAFVCVLLLSVAFPFYSSLKNLYGMILISLLFWISVVIFFSLIYFFPILSRLEKNPFKILKKCFLIFFDNTGFTVLMMIGSIVIIGLSVFVGFLIPGIGTLLLWWNVGLKLRLYKYDYLEKYPDTKRNKIPWRRLLNRDMDRVGKKRTLKGLIFPWKE